MGGGGTLGAITEMATGGLVKSGMTKMKEKEAAQAQAQQAALVKKEKDRVMKEEEERKKRTLMARQGRRGLLWNAADELGVQKKTTLGG